MATGGEDIRDDVRQLDNGLLESGKLRESFRERKMVTYDEWNGRMKDFLAESPSDPEGTPTSDPCRGLDTLSNRCCLVAHLKTGEKRKEDGTTPDRVSFGSGFLVFLEWETTGVGDAFIVTNNHVAMIGGT